MLAAGTGWKLFVFRGILHFKVVLPENKTVNFFAIFATIRNVGGGGGGGGIMFYPCPSVCPSRLKNFV